MATPPPVESRDPSPSDTVGESGRQCSGVVRLTGDVRGRDRWEQKEFEVVWII